MLSYVLVGLFAVFGLLCLDYSNARLWLFINHPDLAVWLYKEGRLPRLGFIFVTLLILFYVMVI